MGTQQGRDFSLANGHSCVAALGVSNHLASGNEQIDVVHLLFYLQLQLFDKTRCLNFLNKAQVDEVLGIGLGRLRPARRHIIEESFDALRRRQRHFRQYFDVCLISSIETSGIGNLSVRADNL